MEVDENNPWLLELSSGDMVKATGIIYRAGVSLAMDGVVMAAEVEVFSTDSVETTFEKYEEPEEGAVED